MEKILNLINHSFLHRLPIEVYQDGELIGTGIIIQHTKDYIKLDDGMYYMKRNCEFRIKT